jgi:hypothetical protein
VLLIWDNDRSSALHQLRATPANLDAMPFASAMAPAFAALLHKSG